MIKFSSRGGFDNTERFLKRSKEADYRRILEKYALEGVQVLGSATPEDTGQTSESWSYQIVKTNKGFKIHWLNDNVRDGVPIVILLQYGHGTRSGTFIEGRDFINPVMRPLFEKISENLWKEASNL